MTNQSHKLLPVEQETSNACGEEKSACDHDFKGWREFADGCGGETVCAKCGIGAMSYTLSLGI